MATAVQPASSVRRAESMRYYWNAVKGRSAPVLKRIATFFLAFPPLAQGIYYLLFGLWPFLRAATGAGNETMTHTWLAESAGVLMLVIGATLCLAAYRRQGSPEVLLLAFGSAFGFVTLELVWLLQGRISALYVIDVLIQVGLVAFWVYGWRMKERALAQAPVASPTAESFAGAVPKASPLVR